MDGAQEQSVSQALLAVQPGPARQRQHLYDQPSRPRGLRRRCVAGCDQLGERRTDRRCQHDRRLRRHQHEQFHRAGRADLSRNRHLLPARVPIGPHRREISPRQRRGATDPGSTSARGAAFAAESPRSRDKAAPPLFKAIAGILPNPDMYMRTAVAPFGVRGPSGRERAEDERRHDRARSLAARLADERVSHVIDLIATAFTREGKPLGSRRQTARLTLRPTEAARRGTRSFRDSTLKPGRYQLRFATHNAALEKSGSVYVDVDVPDFAKEQLSLSGVVLATDPALPAAGVDLARRNRSGHANDPAQFQRAGQGDGLPAGLPGRNKPPQPGLRSHHDPGRPGRRGLSSPTRRSSRPPFRARGRPTSGSRCRWRR